VKHCRALNARPILDNFLSHGHSRLFPEAAIGGPGPFHGEVFIVRTTKMASIMAVLGATAAACQSGDGPSAPEPAPPPGGGAVSMYAEPALDVASSVPAAALAFSYDGAVYRGGYRTHDVTVTDGVIDVTPWHTDPITGKRAAGGAIGLSTNAVSAGDRALATYVGAPRLAGNVVEIPRGELTERITNREDGVEQAWRFDAVPGGGDGGDLTVEVTVAGQRFVAATASGLHFQSDRGLGFRYSHAVWRDATGSAWEIEARYEGGRIAMTVPADVLAASAYPAVLDPTITGELFTDVPVNGTTGANSRAADLASDGTQYLAVWQDQRDSRDDDIFATRLGADGAVIDATGIRVNAAAGVQQNPVAAFVGTGYVVAWENVVATGNSDIAAAFVSATGDVTQLGTIAGTGANETLPAIAARGGEALLVWQDGADVRGAVFSGGAFGPAFPVAAGTNIEKEPAVSGNPAGDYLVAFTETVGTNDNVRGQLVTAAGALTGAAFDLAAGTTAEGAPAAAFDGTNHVVVWSVVHGGTSNDIAARRVGPTGALLETAPVNVSLAAGAQVSPDVACNPGGCLVTWEDTRNLATSLRDVYGAVLSPTLAVTAADVPVSTFTRQQTSPAVASAGTGYLAAWSDARDLDTTSIRASRVDAAGAVQDAAEAALVVVRSVSNYQAPAIGQTSGFFDLVFPESQVPDVNLVHVRFDGQAIQRDPTPLVVSAAPAAQLAPAATGMGANAFAVWQDARNPDRDIYGARIDMLTGATLDPAGIQITSGNGEQVVPKVASAGTSALVVWQDRRAGNFDIMGAVVSSTGAVTAADIPICAAAGDQTRPNVAYDATNNVYLVVWTDPQGGTLDIRGARVSPAGAVLDGGCGAVISGAAGSQFSADVAAGNGQFLVAWEDRRADAANGDIYGARVAVAGAISVLDPAGLAIAAAPGQQTEPTVAFGSGGSFVVAWTDARNAATTSNDILGVQISTAGVIGSPFTIAGSTESERTPDLSPGTTTAKPLSVAYLISSTALGSTRVQLRRITVGSTGGKACTADSQCETGFCRDYKCCNSDCGGGGANGNTGDCQACSTAHYGQADGTCTTILDTSYVCRLYASSFCDVSERCDGTSTVCPPDLGQRGGKVCNASIGAVCPPNDVTGAPHVCPM
jgi:hypothetical protein